MKALLFLKNQCGISCKELDHSENEIDRGQEIEREHVKLNADPEHQCHTKEHSETDAQRLFPEQKNCCRQIGQAVDYQQSHARKNIVLIQNIRQRKLFEIGQHILHLQKASVRFDKHAHGTNHSSDADKQAPEQQRGPGRLQTTFIRQFIHTQYILMVFVEKCGLPLYPKQTEKLG